MLRLFGLLILAGAPLCAQPVKVAVLRDELAKAAIENAGVAARTLDVGQLESAESFNASLYDCLVLSQSHGFSAAAKQNLMRFLKDGGDLVLLGGVGFTEPDSMLLPAFSRYEPYVMKDIVSVKTDTNQDLLPPMQASGRFAGYSAVGFNRVSAKFIPLLGAIDADGRARGWAAGLLTHFAEYKGSNWLLFGISNPEFYRSSIFADTLRAMLPKMKSAELERAAGVEHENRLRARIKLTSPAPAGFLRLSDDGKHIVYPDGRRFFMIGANYHRPLNGALRDAREFDHLSLEDDFRKARDAGVNCMRVGFSPRFYEDAELVKECARKYGIYLLVIVNGGIQQDFMENAARTARLYADEPMVMGYDLQNEPKVDALAALRFDGAPGPVLRLHPEFEGNLPAFTKLWKESTAHLTQGSMSTFPGLAGVLEAPTAHRELYAAMNETLNLWIGKQIAAIRQVDKHHLISVGYNSVLECLPANKQLNFVSHHVYDRPASYEKVMSNITTLDRIARVWPDRPITLGEFGYSNGIVTADESYLDFHTSAVGEMIHYLYALTHGYDGAMKWVLTDWHWNAIAKAAEKGRKTQIYEAYFGIYYYDGNQHGLGQLKPIGHAMKFLREYVDANGIGGNLDIRHAQTSIGTGYVYKAANALFVGDSAYRSPEMEFQARSPANVMLTWNASGGIKLMSTADATVSIAPERFLPKLKSARAKDGRISMRLLEGETVWIR